MNQNLIVNVVWTSFVNMQGTLFVVNAFEDVIVMVEQCSHCIDIFFGGRQTEFRVIIKVYRAWI